MYVIWLNIVLVRVNFRNLYSVGEWRYTLFWQKFRESNFFTKELNLYDMMKKNLKIYSQCRITEIYVL